MKRSFFIFLMLLMLMPGLACAMPSCMDGKPGTTQEKPCHDEDGRGQKHHGPMSNAECAKTVLYGSGDQVVKAPDIKGKVFVFAIAHPVLLHTFSIADVRSIRGPPPDWPGPSDTQPSILRTAQRFRE